LQRVLRASVSVDDEEIGAIDRGLLVLVGIAATDNHLTAVAAADKIAGLRVFDDVDGRMNLDLKKVGGSVLLVSQFTLLAALDKGRRPSFAQAALPELAEPLVEELAGRLRERGCPVECGRFGARMQVELVNDGPVTLVLDLPAGENRTGTR
jgi:D-tyrosyl-tRNA(Tyr) deacylase